MNHQTHSGDGGRETLVRRYEYDDGLVLVADVDAADDRLSVDVVDGTAIVVAEADDGPVEREFDLPEGDAHTFINNGVVTIEVKR